MGGKNIKRRECAALQIVGRASRLPSNDSRSQSGRLGEPSVGFRLALQRRFTQL